MPETPNQNDQYAQQLQRRRRRRRAVARRRRLLLIAIAAVVVFLGYTIWDVLRPPEFKDNTIQPVNGEQTSTEKSNDLDAQTPVSEVTEPVEVKPEKPPKVRKENYYTFVLAGTNDDYNTDTIMLGSVDTEKDIVNVVSIPRDTMIDIPNNIKKINSSYGRNGMDELCYQLQQVTGVYPDYYCLVNMTDFIKVVDVIGGVYFDVPYDMYHEDADERFNINLSKGYQLLDGKKAIQLVRFRGTSASDFGRMEVQRDFLKAVGKKLVDEFTISQASDIITTVSKSIKTNMPVKDMIWFYINVAREIDFDNAITFDTMPGTSPGTWKGLEYIYLSPRATVDYINQKINPFTTDLDLDDVHIISLVDK